MATRPRNEIVPDLSPGDAPHDPDGVSEPRVCRNVPHGGLIVAPHPITRGKLIIDLVAHDRLPAIYPFRFHAKDGGLVSYGIDQVDQWRSAATYVDRILRGTNAKDLPVQQPTKYELVINLKTAKALGLEVPPTLLARADEVIE
jgi:putative ABC transport system substrate-binding protein